MAVSAIVATPGDPNANSFIDEAFADQYIEDRLNAADIWPPADPEDERRALIEATRDLTRLAYIGQRTDEFQSLSWPRFEAINPDVPSGDDRFGSIDFYDDDEIPDRIMNATAEYALEFIRAGGVDVAGQDASLNIKRTKVDVLETEFFSPSASIKPQGFNRYPRVMSEITPLLDEEATSGSLEVLRA